MTCELPVQMLELGEEASSSSKSDAHKQCLLRLPVEVRERLRGFAKVNHRSFTAEVLMRLETSMANESINKHGVVVVTPAPREGQGVAIATDSSNDISPRR
jgi:Arc-like DNA binding domain